MMLRTLDVLKRARAVYESCENYSHVYYAKRYVILLVKDLAWKSVKKYGEHPRTLRALDKQLKELRGYLRDMRKEADKRVLELSEERRREKERVRYRR